MATKPVTMPTPTVMLPSVPGFDSMEVPSPPEAGSITEDGILEVEGGSQPAPKRTATKKKADSKDE